MKKALITGADGFIGTHLITELVKNNIEVWAIVHPTSPTKERIKNNPHIHCIECDIFELQEYISCFPFDIDVCYHLAWQGVNALERDDLSYQMQNISLGIKCIEFAAQINIKKMIFPGSTSEYLFYGKPIDKNATPSASNAYGTVKIAFRYIAEHYTRKLGLEYVYVVLSSIYAADRRDNNVIFYTIDKLLNEEKPSLTKLEQLWDYIHISDAVTALRLVGEKGKPYSFYAIGCGDNQPLYEYIYCIRDYINPSLPLGIGDIPYSSDILPCSCVDIDDITHDTGFLPQIHFADGIKEVIDTMKKEKLQ